MSGSLRRWERTARVRARRWTPVLAGVFIASVAVPPAAVLATGSVEVGLRTVMNLVLAGSWTLALLLGSGGVGAQLRSGTAVLWLQKPVRAPLLYLHRLVARLGVTVLSILLLTGIGVVVATAVGATGGVGDVRTLGLTMAVMGSLVVCVLHGLSGLGLPLEALFGMLVVMALVLLGWRVTESPETLGWLLPLARAAAFPLDAVEVVARFLSGLPVDGTGHEAFHVVAYGAGWAMLGTVASALSARSPLPRGSD